MSIATIAAAGYAAFLVVFALGLDFLGRYRLARHGRLRTRGFSYQPEPDPWQRPEGGDPAAGATLRSARGGLHRGISIALLSIASLVALVGVLLTPALPDLGLLGMVLGVTLVVALRLSLAGMPSGFPDRAWGPGQLR